MAMLNNQMVSNAERHLSQISKHQSKHLLERDFVISHVLICERCLSALLTIWLFNNPSLEFNPGGVSRVYAASRVVNAPSCELPGAQRARCYVEADEGQRGRVMFNVEHLGFVGKQATHKEKSSCSPLKIIKVYWNADLGMYPSHYSWLDPLTHKLHPINAGKMVSSPM